MESSTKNKQSDKIINEMVCKAFGEVKTVEIQELKEGFFNAAYEIKLSNGKEVILKISPPEDVLIMTHEKNIMFAETDVMKMLRRKTNLPIAEVLYYDNSHSICKADYFFMSKIQGDSLNSILKEIKEEDKKNIYYELGKFNRSINNIIGKKFGYYSQSDKQGDKWYEVFSSMVGDVINDAKALNVDIETKYDVIGSLLERDKSIFEEVEVPKLVHWDLWAGNVFVKNGQITGLIDFERCIWADELMEVGFRSYGNNKDFYKGYGIEELTETQRIRSKWYDLYLFLINALECDYRHYEGREMYNWAKQKIIETIEILSNL